MRPEIDFARTGFSAQRAQKGATPSKMLLLKRVKYIYNKSGGFF